MRRSVRLVLIVLLLSAACALPARAQEAAPLNAVDNMTRAMVAQVLVDLHARGKTFVTATHDLGRLETDFDDALYLSEGRQVEAPPGAFSSEHDHPHSHHESVNSGAWTS